MENTHELIYIGYRSFNGKKDPDKVYYVLRFMTRPIVTKNSAYCENIDIFVEKDVYNSFIKETDLLDNVDVNCRIVGNKVQYSIN